MKFDPQYLFPQLATTTEMKKKGNKYCQNVVKNQSKSSKKFVKKLSKICQKVVKVVKKLYKFQTSGEDEEEEEDWWLKDQVATSSHLVKSVGCFCRKQTLIVSHWGWPGRHLRANARKWRICAIFYGLQPAAPIEWFLYVNKKHVTIIVSPREYYLVASLHSSPVDFSGSAVVFHVGGSSCCLVAMRIFG
jgi:hypothetical protein